MTTHKLYFKVRDTLVSWGVVSRPRFYLERRATGSVRESLQGRGSRRRLRRTSLQRLLR